MSDTGNIIALTGLLVGCMVALMCVAGYELYQAPYKLTQSINDISEIIDNNENMTAGQKVALITTMCNNRNGIKGMSGKCKEDLFLKYMW